MNWVPKTAMAFARCEHIAVVDHRLPDVKRMKGIEMIEKASYMEDADLLQGDRPRLLFARPAITDYRRYRRVRGDTRRVATRFMATTLTTRQSTNLQTGQYLGQAPTPASRFQQLSI